MYSIVGYSVLFMSIRSMLVLLFKPSLFPYILSGCFVYYCEWGIEVFIIVEVSISPFNSVSYCFIYFDGLSLGT